MFVQLRFRSVSIISGNFESRFKQCDESEVNADRQKRRCNKSLITVRLEKRRFPESGQQALTVALESAVTMRRGGPALLPAPVGAQADCVHRRRSRRCRVFRENFCWGRGRGETADCATPIRLALPIRRLSKTAPSEPSSGQRTVAVRSRRERIETRGWGIARRRRALRGMKFHQRLR